MEDSVSYVSYASREHTPPQSDEQQDKPAMARSSLRLAPNVVIPSSLRSPSVSVKNDDISICQQHHNNTFIDNGDAF